VAFVDAACWQFFDSFLLYIIIKSCAPEPPGTSTTLIKDVLAVIKDVLAVLLFSPFYLIMIH